jgi:peroxiredoxin
VSERLRTDAELVLVTFTTAELLDEYQQRRELSVPILIDRDRAVYAAYGLGRGTIGQVWGWATLRRYAQILRRSGRGLADLAPTTEDTRQLGGDFVIAPDGRLSWGFWSEGPSDRPSVDDVLRAVERAAAA